MLSIIEKESLLDILSAAPCSLAGQFVNSSNYTFFITLDSPQGEMRAVYKPVRGETPLWDFAAGSLARREVAAYHLSEILGWRIVPPTVFRKKSLPFGAGSVQQYIEHDTQKHYFNFSAEEKDRLRPVALFDCLTNNADRKGSHIILSKEGKIFCIDHGVCFHVEDKLRTVIWDFAGQPIPPDLLEDVEVLADNLENQTDIPESLTAWLRKGEIKALLRRSRYLLKTGRFPQIDKSRRQIPWPPV
jgi:hypothetical protein